MNDIEHRAFVLDEIRVARKEGEPPRLIGHAAMFNVLSEDLGGFRETIAPGAFKDAAQDDVRALFNHNPDFVLGRNKSGTLRLGEDDKGLVIDIALPDTQVARDLAVSIDRGDISQMSFGFRVKPNGQAWSETDQGTVRTLTAVRLYDVSPVTYPAYPQTDIAVRSLNDWRASRQETAPPQKGAENAKRGRSLRLLEIETT